MHHGQTPSPDFSEQTKAQTQALSESIESLEGKLGATKRFPEGKLTKEDEGELRFAVIQHEGKVVLEFGHPVAWLGMNSEQAIHLGRLLITRGEQCRAGS